jgi:hypothetical protein
MTQNSRTIIHTARGRLGIVAAGVIMAVSILTPASALAAPVAPTSADSSVADLDVTGAVPGASTDCTYSWEWQADAEGGIGGYSEVEWTSNPCGFSIQERSWCDDILNPNDSGWATSGVVIRTDLWDKSSCDPDLYRITRGEVRFNFGSGWSAYQTFWTP